MQHSAPLKPQNLPAKHATPTCGAKKQYADNDDDMKLVLPDNKIKFIQKSFGITSYYATALDNTALMALAASQSSAKNPQKTPLRNFWTTSQHIQPPKSDGIKAL